MNSLPADLFGMSIVRANNDYRHFINRPPVNVILLIKSNLTKESPERIYFGFCFKNDSSLRKLSNQVNEANRLPSFLSLSDDCLPLGPDPFGSFRKSEYHHQNVFNVGVNPIDDLVMS